MKKIKIIFDNKEYELNTNINPDDYTSSIITQLFLEQELDNNGISIDDYSPEDVKRVMDRINDDEYMWGNFNENLVDAFNSPDEDA